LASRKRLKASWTSAEVQGFGFGDFLIDFLGAADLGGDPGAAFFAGFPGAERTRVFLARRARMILAMNRVY